MRPMSIRRQRQRGFALLFVFAMAGIAALMLYIELPRAVFESQRAKEELLVNRGREYQRGLQLYFRKFRKYPMAIEELEKTSGQRFLRRRFVDPMTGKDDWRIINVVNGGYTNSKVIKPPAAAEQKLGSGFGNSTDPNQQPQDPNDPALKKRASDTSASEIGGGQNGPFAQGGGPQAPRDPNGPPPNTAPPPNTVPPAYTPVGVGGVGSAPSNPIASNPIAGAPTYPTGASNSQFGGQIPQPIPGQLQNQPGQRQLTPEQINPALDVIQRLLTTPRQPPPGVLGSSSGQAAANGMSAFPSSGPAAGGGFGGGAGGGAPGLTGIAGFASKKEGKGIKVINERERIEEWEFIYDPAKDQGGRPNQNMQSQQPGQGGMNNNQGGMGGGFGFGGGQQGQGGFGQGGTGQGGRGQGGIGPGDLGGGGMGRGNNPSSRPRRP
jgi:type II secretory pathway pseudopilin PulG